MDPGGVEKLGPKCSGVDADFELATCADETLPMSNVNLCELSCLHNTSASRKNKYGRVLPRHRIQSQHVVVSKPTERCPSPQPRGMGEGEKTTTMTLLQHLQQLASLIPLSAIRREVVSLFEATHDRHSTPSRLHVVHHLANLDLFRKERAIQYCAEPFSPVSCVPLPRNPLSPYPLPPHRLTLLS
jgi:hypothetical protein